MQIELIPELSNPDISDRLEKLFIECVSFRGTTAFWTIDVNFFKHQSFVNALKKPGSFFCTDIQLPTNIQNLLGFYNQGVEEIYLHHYRQKGSRSQNTNLLHSKVLLFELENNEIEIWIGSHNFTRYALTGFNLEASVSIKCAVTDSIFSQVNAYLKEIKQFFCVKFNPEHTDIYEMLQTDKALKEDINYFSKVITLVGENMSDLVKENIIQLLSLTDNEFYSLKKINDEVFIHAIDEQTNYEYLYRCKIEQAGNLSERSYKLSIYFTEPRRLAFIGTKLLCKLRNSALVLQTELAQSKFFVNISVQSAIQKFEVYRKPDGEDSSYWKTISRNPYFDRRKYLPTRFTSDDENIDVKIQVATFNREVSKHKVNLKQDWEGVKFKLEKFYRELSGMLENEIWASQKEDTVDLFGYDDYKLKSLLIDIKDYGYLSDYSKTLIERIIVDLSKSTSA